MAYRSGSDEHREHMRQTAIDRHARRRARGLTGRHPSTVPPSFTPKRQHATDDPCRHSTLPGPCRLHEGPTMEELIAERKRKTREEAE